jgi:hypothetical protein
MATLTIDESMDAMSDPKPIEIVTSHLFASSGSGSGIEEGFVRVMRIERGMLSRICGHGYLLTSLTR